MFYLGFDPARLLYADAKASTFDPQIVVLDLGLPGLDGYEVARELRRQPRRVYIAAVTGRGTTEDRVRSLEAGIDMHLVKPTSSDKLAALVDAARRAGEPGAIEPT